MDSLRNIISIDPSFSRTGVAFFDKDGKLKTKSITRTGSNYQIDVCLQHSFEEAKELQGIIEKWAPEEPITICYEYPVMASRSGAYLAVLMSKFDSLFRALYKRGVIKDIIYVPPTAVPAYTGILKKNKTEIVEFAKSIIPDKRYNHDEATAIILSKLCADILSGKYKKTFYRLNLEK